MYLYIQLEKKLYKKWFLWRINKCSQHVMNTLFFKGNGTCSLMEMFVNYIFRATLRFSGMRGGMRLVSELEAFNTPPHRLKNDFLQRAQLILHMFRRVLKFSELK